MSFQYKDGQAGKVVVNTVGSTGPGQILSVKSWKVSDGVNEQDVTSTTSGGFYVSQGVVRKATIDVEADWDSTLYPYAIAPALTPNSLVLIQLFVDATASTPTYDFPKALVLSVDPDVDASAVVKYSLKAVNYGAFTSS